MQMNIRAAGVSTSQNGSLQFKVMSVTISYEISKRTYGMRLDNGHAVDTRP